MSERHGVALEPAIYADIRQAEPGSTLFWELIREAKRLAREGKLDGEVQQQRRYGDDLGVARRLREGPFGAGPQT